MNERGTSDSTDMKRKIKEYQEQRYSNKQDNLDVTDKCVETNCQSLLKKVQEDLNITTTKKVQFRIKNLTARKTAYPDVFTKF